MEGGLSITYPAGNKLVGDYLGAGACGFAFKVVGEPDMVLKVSRLVDYKTIDPDTISDFRKDGLKDYQGWDGGVALNEFQTVMFSQLWDMKMKGEEYTAHLPDIYAFSSGEMKQEMLDEIDRSFDHYGWDSNKYRTIKNSFHPRKGDTPGTRIGLWVIEKVKDIGGDSTKAKAQSRSLNKWLRTHNYIVRDTQNRGNWGLRPNTDEIVWFDPGVSPWPIQESWKDSDDVKMRNLYYLFQAAFGQGEIGKYERALENPEDFDKTWWQAEDVFNIEEFLAESEIVGEYMDSGMAGSVFALNGDKVIKIAKLNHLFHDRPINRDQQEFIEDVYIRKNKGEKIPEEMVDILHYNKGTVTPKMAKLINEKAPSHPLKEGEPVGIWIMERIPTIGNGSMTYEQRERGKKDLSNWGQSIGYGIHDLHDKNYGQRSDGSFVAFDPWPIKISEN